MSAPGAWLIPGEEAAERRMLTRRGLSLLEFSWLLVGDRIHLDLLRVQSWILTCLVIPDHDKNMNQPLARMEQEADMEGPVRAPEPGSSAGYSPTHNICPGCCIRVLWGLQLDSSSPKLSDSKAH